MTVQKYLEDSAAIDGTKLWDMILKTIVAGMPSQLFPRSVVIYPEQNKAIPEYLQCRVVFQDDSEHIYKVPTVKVQTYSGGHQKETSHTCLMDI